MATIKWVKGEVDGRIGVCVPFRQLFNDELKATVSSAKFVYHPQKAWLFDEESKPAVMQLLEKFYTGAKTWHRVEWELSDARQGPIVDGCNLIDFGRDHWWWLRGHGFDMHVIESDVDTGGSRANPRISGRVVIEIAIREGAVLEPEPTSCTPIDAPPVPANPLANIPDSDLIAELKKRERPLFEKDDLRAAAEAALKVVFRDDLSQETKVTLRDFLLYFRKELEI